MASDWQEVRLSRTGTAVVRGLMLRFGRLTRGGAVVLVKPIRLDKSIPKADNTEIQPDRPSPR